MHSILYYHAAGLPAANPKEPQSLCQRANHSFDNRSIVCIAKHQQMVLAHSIVGMLSEGAKWIAATDWLSYLSAQLHQAVPWQLLGLQRQLLFLM